MSQFVTEAYSLRSNDLSLVDTVIWPETFWYVGWLFMWVGGFNENVTNSDPNWGGLELSLAIILGLIGRKKSNASFDIIPTNNKENRNQSKKPKSKPTKGPRRKPLSDSSVANLLETISTPSRRINSNRNNNITTPVRRF